MAVIEATSNNFDSITQGDYVVMDLYGDNCGACVLLAPIFEAASIDMPFVSFAHMNISQDTECREIANRFNITAIPTLLYFRNGKLIFKTVGSMERKELDEQLSRLLYKEN